jgi:hypothetical protein
VGGLSFHTVTAADCCSPDTHALGFRLCRCKLDLDCLQLFAKCVSPTALGSKVRKGLVSVACNLAVRTCSRCSSAKITRSAWLSASASARSARLLWASTAACKTLMTEILSVGSGCLSVGSAAGVSVGGEYWSVGSLCGAVLQPRVVGEGLHWKGTSKLGQDRPMLSRSAAQLRARAQDLQQLAKTSRTIVAVAAMPRLADRYQALAETREQENASEPPVTH